MTQGAWNNLGTLRIVRAFAYPGTAAEELVPAFTALNEVENAGKNWIFPQAHRPK
jgi:hypothetical protein